MSGAYDDGCGNDVEVVVYSVMSGAYDDGCGSSNVEVVVYSVMSGPMMMVVVAVML